MLLSLFIPLLVISTFVDKYVAAVDPPPNSADPPNSVEQMMLHICVDVLHIKENRSKHLLAKGFTMTRVIFGLLKKNRYLIEEAVKMHVLLKLVAGTIEVRKNTLDNYLELCDKLVKNESIRKAEEKELKGKNEESSSSGKGKGKKEEAGSSHDDGQTAKHKGKQEENANANTNPSIVLAKLDLTEADWKILTQPIKIELKSGSILKNGVRFNLGFGTQQEAEEKMKTAFDSFIQNDQKKKEKIYKLCFEIQTLAREVYAGHIKEETFGKFCEHFKPNEHQNEAQSSGAVAEIQETE